MKREEIIEIAATIADKKGFANLTLKELTRVLLSRIFGSPIISSIRSSIIFTRSPPTEKQVIYYNTNRFQIQVRAVRFSGQQRFFT
jgi:hypothetical protein